LKESLKEFSLILFPIETTWDKNSVSLSSTSKNVNCNNNNWRRANMDLVCFVPKLAYSLFCELLNIWFYAGIFRVKKSFYSMLNESFHHNCKLYNFVKKLNHLSN
jgi:hypothetical protein